MPGACLGKNDDVVSSSETEFYPNFRVAKD
jgi:hypothetical protein